MGENDEQHVLDLFNDENHRGIAPTLTSSATTTTTRCTSSIRAITNTNVKRDTTTTTSITSGRNDLNELEACLYELDSQQMNLTDGKGGNNNNDSYSVKGSSDTTTGTFLHQTNTSNCTSTPPLLLPTTHLWKEPISPITNSSSSSFIYKSLHEQKFKNRKDVMLPNIQVELSRHKHMGELSKYLLSSSSLRMPTFERWIIDSKLQEQVKQERKKELLYRERQQEERATAAAPGNKRKKNRKRQRHQDNSFCPINTILDPVLPSIAEWKDEASQRLCHEIYQSLSSSSSSSPNDHDLSMTQIPEDTSSSSSPMWNKAVQTCKELCRRSNEASRQVYNLNCNLNGGPTIQEFFRGTSGSGGGYGSGGKKKKSKSCGRITLEIHHGGDTEEEDQNGDIKNDTESENRVYSLVYTRKKQSNGSGGGAGAIDRDGTKATSKPFIIKINSHHYDKLRTMFHSIHDTMTTTTTQTTLLHHQQDDLHMYIPPLPTTIISGNNSNNNNSNNSSTKSSSPNNSYYTPATNIFHHLLFCSLVRYASLSGGQQLLDLRGGGMQGAVHSQVFDFLMASTHVVKLKSDHDLVSPKNDIQSNHDVTKRQMIQVPSKVTSTTTTTNTHMDTNNNNDNDNNMTTIMECFASPFNVYNTHFCSMFYNDLDCHFGSSGDFFTLPLGYFARVGHVHEANPPFCPYFMKRMVQRMNEHLEYADAAAAAATDDNDGASSSLLSSSSSNRNEQSLTFLIVVPTCDMKRNKKRSMNDERKNSSGTSSSSKRKKKLTSLNDDDNSNGAQLIQMLSYESFQCCLESPFFVKHVCLKAREHGMIEGSQHLRPTRYKESQYDTSVIILQSSYSRKCEKINPKFTSSDFEDGLRKAFASRHGQDNKALSKQNKE